MVLVIVKDGAYVRDIVMFENEVDEETIRKALLAERKMRESEKISIIPIRSTKKKEG